MGAHYNVHTRPLFKHINIVKLHDSYELQIAKYIYSYSQNTLPIPQMTLFTSNDNIHTHDTGNRHNPHISQRRITTASKSLRHKGPDIWYKIPEEITSRKNITSFSKDNYSKLLVSVLPSRWSRFSIWHPLMQPYSSLDL